MSRLRAIPGIGALVGSTTSQALSPEQAERREIQAFLAQLGNKRPSDPAPAPSVELLRNAVYLLPLASNKAVVVKASPSVNRSEAYMQEWASTHGVLAPRVISVASIARGRQSETAIIMQHVTGKRLDHVWPHLTAPQRNDIKRQLAIQIRTMRSLTQPFIGRLDTERNKTIAMRHIYSQIEAQPMCGPFRDEKAFDQWCVDQLLVGAGFMEKEKKAWWIRWLEAERNKRPAGERRKFVLTHGDLMPWNIMVDGTRVTAILDWEKAAFMPDYAEYVMAEVLYPWERTGHKSWWWPVLKDLIDIPTGIPPERFMLSDNLLYHSLLRGI